MEGLRVLHTGLDRFSLLNKFSKTNDFVVVSTRKTKQKERKNSFINKACCRFSHSTTQLLCILYLRSDLLLFFFFNLSSEGWESRGKTHLGCCYSSFSRFRFVLIQAFTGYPCKEDFIETCASCLLRLQHPPQSHLPDQFPLLPANQSQCKKCHALVFYSC